MNHSASKTIHVCYAHRLQDHLGECKNLHGHNGKVVIHYSSPTLNYKTGMIVDFAEIDKRFQLIKQLLDHNTILQDNDPLVEPLTKFLNDNHLKVPVVLRTPPTAEAIAQFIATSMRPCPDRVEFWETPTCRGEWSR